MKKLLATAMILALAVPSMAQNPFLDEDSGSSQGPSHVGGSVTVNVNALVSTEDAQKLLDMLGPITVQNPIKSYYVNPPKGITDAIREGTLKGLFKNQVSGNTLSVGLTPAGNALVVNTVSQGSVQTWYLALGLCANPIASHTTLGTKSGKPGQTLHFSLNLDINSTLGNIIGYEPENRYENEVDILPSSSGWIIDQKTLTAPIKQASATNIGRILHSAHVFCQGLPDRLMGKTWTREKGNEKKRDRYTFLADGTCTYFDSKTAATKKGNFTIKGNAIKIRFMDGDNMNVFVDYNEYGEDWLAMTNKRLIWSIKDWRYFSSPE